MKKGNKEPCKPIKNFATKQNTHMTTHDYRAVCISKGKLTRFAVVNKRTPRV